jgi:endonuclease YncB( thermonuclease family)
MHGTSETLRQAATHVIGRFAAMLLAASLLALGQLASAAELRGTVVAISDGDTLTVLDAANSTHRVRLDGIDAPEKGQAYGTRSREHLAALAFGKPVVVVWSKRDRYGRIVGQVNVGESHDVGLALIEAGLAWHYKRYQHEQPASERVRYARAEDAARARRSGLWQDRQPVPPWEYRSARRPG